MDEEIQDDVQEAEAVEEVEVAEVVEPVAETIATKPTVVGEITPAEIAERNLIKVNICRECGYVHKPGKGVTQCAMCGGKTVEGFAEQADKIKSEDAKRFPGSNKATE